MSNESAASISETEAGQYVMRALRGTDYLLVLEAVAGYVFLLSIGMYIGVKVGYQLTFWEFHQMGYRVVANGMFGQPKVFADQVFAVTMLSLVVIFVISMVSRFK